MLRANIIANYLGQAYAAVSILVALPLYGSIWGAEALGVITFYVILNGWIFILSSGLSPILSRQIAIFKAARNLGSTKHFQVQRSLEVIFAVLTIVTFGAVFGLRQWVSEEWLNTDSVERLPEMMAVMAVALACRWGASLFFSGLVGLEKQVWLNGFNSVVISLRWFSLLAVSLLFEVSLYHFFITQAVVGIVELVCLTYVFYRESKMQIKFQIGEFVIYKSEVRELGPFAAGLMYSSFLWAWILNFEKTITSGALTMVEYGYFAFAAILANFILRLTQPINQAFLPRIIAAYSKRDGRVFRKTYATNCELVIMVGIASATVLLIVPFEVLFVVTGSEELAVYGSDLLAWMSLSAVSFLLTNLIYNFLLACGEMRLHVINQSIAFLVQVPLSYFLLDQFGVEVMLIGLAIVRLGHFLIYLVLIYGSFSILPGIRIGLALILWPVVGAMLAVLLLQTTGMLDNDPTRDERWASVGQLAVVSSIVFLSTLIFSNSTRKYVLGTKRFEH
ncbi:MAG: MATE family efflux transporter [Pseudomonadota bacterium]